jgi:hypothetical protein
MEITDLVSQLILLADRTRRVIGDGSITEATAAEADLLIGAIELLNKYPAIIRTARG